MEDFMEFVLAKMIGPALVLLVALCLFVGLPAMIYESFQESKRPTFYLKKSEWSCTQTTINTQIIYMMVGKIMVPQPVTTHDCVTWTKK